MKQTTLAAAFSTVLGVTAMEPASAVGLADGFYDMVIHNTPMFTTPYGPGYDFGTDGAWNSSFTTGSVFPSSGSSHPLYDDTIAQPANGKYSGVANDGVAGTIGIQVAGGVITGTGKFELDTVDGTVGGEFVEYGGSNGFMGTIDSAGNISLAPTGLLGTFSGFPALVDERWNVNDLNGATGTNINPPNSNTAWDVFSTGSATNATGTINGAAYDGSTAILVKGGRIGSDWGGFFGAGYFEVWNVSFNPVTVLVSVPIPAAIWLFASGLLGVAGVARRKHRSSS